MLSILALNDSLHRTRGDSPAANSTATPATAITEWSTYSEYGEPTVGGTTGTNASSGVLGYGWLGGAQRATTGNTAGLTLMGARVYNNRRGLFTSLDPVSGGNETSHTYPNDPINNDDIDGQWRWPKFVKKAWSETKNAGRKVKKAYRDFRRSPRKSLNQVWNRYKHKAINLAVGSAATAGVAACILAEPCGVGLAAVGGTALFAAGFGAHRAVSSQSDWRRNAGRYARSTAWSVVKGGAMGTLFGRGLGVAVLRGPSPKGRFLIQGHFRTWPRQFARHGRRAWNWLWH